MYTHSLQVWVWLEEKFRMVHNQWIWYLVQKNWTSWLVGEDMLCRLGYLGRKMEVIRLYLLNSCMLSRYFMSVMVVHYFGHEGNPLFFYSLSRGVNTSITMHIPCYKFSLDVMNTVYSDARKKIVGVLCVCPLTVNITPIILIPCSLVGIFSESSIKFFIAEVCSRKHFVALPEISCPREISLLPSFPCLLF